MDQLQTTRDAGHFLYPGTCRKLTDNDIKKRINQGISFTYRIRIPKEGETRFDDIIYGSICVDNKELDDFIVIRSNGSPTYNFTAVIDDYDMNIKEWEAKGGIGILHTNVGTTIGKLKRLGYK